MVAGWVCKPDRGGIKKGTMPFVSIFLSENVAPSALALKPDNSLPPYIPLALFELQLQCWSSELASPQ